MNDYTMKRCSKCGQEKPATTDYFYHSKRHLCGLNPQCKECVKIRQNAHRQRNADRIRQFYRERAKRLYDTDPAYRQRVKEQSLARGKKKYATDEDFRQRAIERSHKYYQENRDYIRAREQERMSHPQNIQQRREYDRLRSQTPHRKKQVNLTHSKRRARQRQLPDNFTHEQRQVMLKYWNNSCCICGQLRDFWHVIADDHWIAINDPRPDNPGTVRWNMLPMCHTTEAGMGGCNNSKGDKDPIEWLNWKFGKKKAKTILARILAYFEWVKQQD